MTAIFVNEEEGGVTSLGNKERALVLCADDDPITIKILSAVLDRDGYRLICVADGVEAMKRVSNDVAVAILDLNMPRAGGRECLSYIRAHHPQVAVIMISALGEVSDVAAAMKDGAFWYIKKPIDTESLLATVSKALDHHALLVKNGDLMSVVESPRIPLQLVGESPSGKLLLEQIDRIAASDAAVLITGESGTGKTTLARYIHHASARAHGPFVGVSCAALPRDLLEAELFGHEKGAFTGAISSRPGRLEMADKGTVFLDEIGDLPIDMQPKLLTFLQEKSFQRIGSVKEKIVDVRLIAATLQDLDGMCAKRLFREDLYYRLNVLTIRVPPLRQRVDDIPVFVQSILRKINLRHPTHSIAISSESLMALVQYDWPGNIRELENVLERACAFCEGGLIRPTDLTLVPRVSQRREAIASVSMAGMPLDQVEAMAISETLKMCHGNKARAARQLGISEKSIYNKIKRLKIDVHKLAMEP